MQLIMANYQTFNVHFYLKKHRLTQGEAPIYMRISLNAQKIDFSMHQRIDPELWSDKMGRASGSVKKIRDLNSYLDSMKSKVTHHFITLRESTENFSLETLRNAFLGIKEEKKGPMVIEKYLEHNKKIKLLEGIDFAPQTIERYETSLKHTRDFIRYKYGRDDLFLSELDNEFIVDYDIYLKTQRNCAHNTSLKYIKNFKKIINLAIANGHLSADPFTNFKAKLKPVDRGFLNEEELNLIISKNFNNRLSEVRDCFVFSCFTGLAYSDILSLSKENIVTGSDGNIWIKIKRKKTSNLSSIPILAITQKLIDKYQYHPECMAKNRLLPVKTNQKMNAYLKEIADICGIEKNFTSHLARHTFATTVTLNNNVPIETVSKMLGHSSINMTRVYARLLDKKVGQDMKQLEGKYDMAV